YLISTQKGYFKPIGLLKLATKYYKIVTISQHRNTNFCEVLNKYIAVAVQLLESGCQLTICYQ
ncbi:Uncharacterized protein APZ42_005198, partial [Daphnia magna]